MKTITNIVKIQRPLMTNGQGRLSALIYNEDRSIMTEVPLEEFSHLFKNDEFKIYHRFKRKNGNFIIKERVKDQNW